MGQLAFLKMFILVSIPVDKQDNRRHVHVFRKNGRHQRSVAKIWIEKNGMPYVEIAESVLSPKDNQMIVDAINQNWSVLHKKSMCFVQYVMIME